MSMTAGNLQAELAKIGSEAEVMIAVNGTFVPIDGVNCVSEASLVVIRGKGKAPPSLRFTVGEDGVIGHLTHLGLADDEIAVILGRPAKSVERRRKTLGLSPKPKS
jgi:hypothetical protein